MHALPDGWDELLAAARAGSAAARGQLLEAHRPYLLAVAAAHLDAALRAKADAADLVQEALVEALADFGRFDGARPDQLRAWLRAILLHDIANLRRHYRGTAMRDVGKEVPLPVPWPDAQPGEHLADEGTTPSGFARRREQTAQLEQVLAELPGHYRDVIVWRNYDGLTFADIGVRLDCTAGAAKQLWMRACHRLSQAWGNRP